MLKKVYHEIFSFLPCWEQKENLPGEAGGFLWFLAGLTVFHFDSGCSKFPGER